MARWLLSTETLIQHLVEGAAGAAIGSRRLSDFAVSALSFEWLLAEAEIDPNLTPSDRRKWRTNVARFRELLLAGGGEMPAISAQALERWGQISLLDLKHADGSGQEPVEMSTEERLVVATAAAGGYIYLTPPRDWNEVIQNEAGVSIEVI